MLDRGRLATIFLEVGGYEFQHVLLVKYVKSSFKLKGTTMDHNQNQNQQDHHVIPSSIFA